MEREQIIKKINALARQNNWSEAIDILKVEKNKKYRPWMDNQIRRLRIQAFDHLPALPTNNNPCPPNAENPFPDIVNELPELDIADLDIAKLSGAIKHHGAIIVRNFLNSDIADQLTQEIDTVMETSKKFLGTEDPKERVRNQWFSPLDTEKLRHLNKGVGMMRQSGAVYAMYSPKVASSLISMFEKNNLKPLLKEYFKENPCLSIKKWVLRKMTPLKSPADWHQDGAFMGKEIKSLNLWIALCDCGKGTNRPGMDLVPKRLHDIVPTGTDGAYFEWSVSQNYVKKNFQDTPPVRPFFGKGDALFFDHLNLHCTTYSEEYTEQRHAIETWFFAESSAPKNQIPIYW